MQKAPNGSLLRLCLYGLLVLLTCASACGKEEPKKPAASVSNAPVEGEASEAEAASKKAPKKASKKTPKPPTRNKNNAVKKPSASKKTPMKKKPLLAEEKILPETVPETVSKQGGPPKGKKAAKGKGKTRRSSPTGGRRRALRVEHLFGESDGDKSTLRKLFDYQGYLAEASFPGQQPSPSYNTYRLKTDKPQQFGFGVQVWKEASPQLAQSHFERLFAQSIGGIKGKEAGDRSFRVENDGLRSFVFLKRPTNTVVWLVCDRALCSFDQLIAFTGSIHGKI